ncbi:MAG: dienelactone hydrolase family protein [Actinobacteria bacterium]|nr:dienelactone hydrolase family protein [Actinomycetota bacterium]
MGEMVSFKSNGTMGQGYLADGGGPGVIVIQEWWGLVPHIKAVADRFASEGFTALAPDLYRGQAASEPDEAGKLMMGLALERAGKDLSGGVDFLQERTGSKKVGVVGYCMGGGLTLTLACQRPDAVRAAAPFYGVIPWAEAQPDWNALGAVVEGHYAENDAFASPEAALALEADLKGRGKNATFHIYPGTHHAFFNDDRPDVYDANAARAAWVRVLALFRANL